KVLEAMKSSCSSQESDGFSLPGNAESCSGFRRCEIAKPVGSNIMPTRKTNSAPGRKRPLSRKESLHGRGSRWATKGLFPVSLAEIVRGLQDCPGSQKTAAGRRGHPGHGLRLVGVGRLLRLVPFRPAPVVHF